MKIDELGKRSDLGYALFDYLFGLESTQPIVLGGDGLILNIADSPYITVLNPASTTATGELSFMGVLKKSAIDLGMNMLKAKELTASTFSSRALEKLFGAPVAVSAAVLSSDQSDSDNDEFDVPNGIKNPLDAAMLTLSDAQISEGGVLVDDAAIGTKAITTEEEATA